MSYDAQETGVQSGAPIELYDFSAGVVTWNYTSSEADITVDATAYTSAAIERTNIEASPEQARNTVTLTVPRTFAIAELFRQSPQSEIVGLSIRRVHRGDLASVIVAWVGRVISCTFEGASAKLQCEPVTVSLARAGLHMLYSRVCRHVLFGSGCRLVKTDFDHATTVSSISGSVLTVGSIGAYNYAGGWVEWVNDDGNTDRRFIESHVGTALTLMLPFAGIAVTDAVTLFPGCDHTLATCNTTFSNAVNYGGVALNMTEKNPFDGTPVY